MIDEIIDIVSRELMVARVELTPDTTLESIAQDSIDIVSLVAAIQSELRVRLEPDDLAGLQTIGDLAIYVESRRGTAQEDPGRKL